MPNYKHNRVAVPTMPGHWWLKDSGSSKWRIYGVYPGSRQRFFGLMIQKGATFPKGEYTGPIPEPPGEEA